MNIFLRKHLLAMPPRRSVQEMLWLKAGSDVTSHMQIPRPKYPLRKRNTSASWNLTSVLQTVLERSFYFLSSVHPLFLQELQVHQLYPPMPFDISGRENPGCTHSFLLHLANIFLFPVPLNWTLTDVSAFNVEDIFADPKEVESIQIQHQESFRDQFQTMAPACLEGCPPFSNVRHLSFYLNHKQGVGLPPFRFGYY